jgi:hypothetical protein
MEFPVVPTYVNRDKVVIRPFSVSLEDLARSLAN